MNKPKCMLTVDVEALTLRAPSDHVNTLIYGRVGEKEYGIGRMMDIADKHNVKMTFFLDFAECELYGDEILEVGRYVESRGHDLQVHCHYDLLKNIVDKEPWDLNGKNYYSWYTDPEDSKKIIDYVTEKFQECTGKLPLAFRGGEYRFGTETLLRLKEKGYTADLSYNYVRPQILSPNKQFKYENGLIEFPIGILPNRKPLNFNYSSLMPNSKSEYSDIINTYKTLFNEYYSYHGNDAIASFLMHSWSFMYSKDRFLEAGFMDIPNDNLADFFDYFISSMKDSIDFVSVSEVLDTIDTNSLKTIDFKAVFRQKSHFSQNNLHNIYKYIIQKAGDRQIVIWGKGWMESTVNMNANINKNINVAYYISNDAEKIPVWRGKPVHKFSDITLDPKRDYIFVLAQPTFSEIRDSLRELGYNEYEDFFDIQKNIPIPNTNGVQNIMKFTCPICNENIFETYNSEQPRRCSTCGSVERTRTVSSLFRDNVKMNLSGKKVLHISPSRPEKLFFKNSGADITTVDVRPECKTNIVADICNMPQVNSDCFDLVFANCVLNHVYDDEKALNEINRVLKKNGIALIWVLDSTTPHTVIDNDPTSWYGQENFEKYRIGTFRHYGEVDFTEQLKRHFSSVKCFEKYDDVTDSSCKWYECIK